MGIGEGVGFWGLGEVVGAVKLGIVSVKDFEG